MSIFTQNKTTQLVHTELQTVLMYPFSVLCEIQSSKLLDLFFDGDTKPVGKLKL